MTTVMLHDGAAAPRLERPQPAVKVVRGGDYGLNRARRFARMVARVLALAIVLGLVISVLYSHAKLTELSGEINEVNTQLAAARSEYDYLSTRMSDITSRASLQEVAEGQRISNYLLWQIAYSELYFCDTFWPDFNEEDLHKAIDRKSVV